MTAIPAEIMIIKKTGLCKHFDAYPRTFLLAQVVTQQVLAS
jgi:hypothetical protein